MEKGDLASICSFLDRPECSPSVIPAGDNQHSLRPGLANRFVHLFSVFPSAVTSQKAHGIPRHLCLSCLIHHTGVSSGVPKFFGNP